MKHNVSQILKAREALASLPKIPAESMERVTTEAAIRLLADELTSLQKKGYSMELLVKALHDQGVDISIYTLRRHLRLVSGTAKRKPKAGPKSRPVVAPESGTAAIKKVTGASGAKQVNPTNRTAATNSSKFAVRGDTDEL